MIALFHECDEECEEYKDKDYPVPNRWVIDKYEFNRCPKSNIDQDAYTWIRAYNLYKSGVMPNAGGWLDQTDKFISIMLFIDSKIESYKRENNGKK